MSILPPWLGSFPSRWQAVGDRVLQALLKRMPAEQQRLLFLTLVIGGVCGLAAVLFHLAIGAAEGVMINRALSTGGHAWIGWTLACTTLGSLASGALLELVSPGARGSGIPQVKTAYAIKSGRVRLRDSLSKFAIAVLQIGSGASLGREGPTVHICAGIATALGRLFALSPRNTRRLLPVGASAGIAAAFNAPIAAVTFTIEEIIGDIDHTMLSGVVVAAALAAVIEHSVLGTHPVFTVPGLYGLLHASSLLVYALLGVAAAFVGNAFSGLLLGSRSWFRALSVPAWSKPGIGGLITGLLAVSAILSVDAHGITGGGYATLSAALVGGLGWKVLLVAGVLKMAATAASYGSGGAGGVFAPTLFIGGMLGGCLGLLDQHLLGHEDTQTGAFALVGMGAVLAAVVRTPITSVLIIFEMTHSYGLVLPLMIASSVAYVLSRQLQPLGIYDALLAQDGVHLPHRHRSSDMLAAFRVSEAMTTELVTLPGSLTVDEGLARIRDLTFTAYPVTDQAGALLGIVSESRLRRRLAEGHGDTLIADCTRKDECLTDHQSLVDAVARMHALGARQMLVVDLDAPERLVGMLAMSDVVRAHARAASNPTAEDDAVDANERRAAVAWPRHDLAEPPVRDHGP
jgi:CIC family chloride channel protein